MSHQNVSSKCFIKMSHQNGSSKSFTKIFNQNISSKCVINMSHHNLSLKYLIKMSLKNYSIKMSCQYFSSKCLIKFFIKRVKTIEKAWNVRTNYLLLQFYPIYHTRMSCYIHLSVCNVRTNPPRLLNAVKRIILSSQQASYIKQKDFCPSSSNLCNAQTNPPEIWNGVDWRALVKH